MELFRIETKKSPLEVVESFKSKVSNFDFIVRDVFDIKKEFSSYGVKVEDGFEYYSILICNPPKAYSTISKSPIRGALVFPPKQIVVYKNKAGLTEISYMKIDSNSIKEMLPEDSQFQENLSKTGDKIIELIKAVSID